MLRVNSALKLLQLLLVVLFLYAEVLLQLGGFELASLQIECELLRLLLQLQLEIFGCLLF